MLEEKGADFAVSITQYADMSLHLLDSGKDRILCARFLKSAIHFSETFEAG